MIEARSLSSKTIIGSGYSQNVVYAGLSLTDFSYQNRIIVEKKSTAQAIFYRHQKTSEQFYPATLFGSIATLSSDFLGFNREVKP